MLLLIAVVIGVLFTTGLYMMMRRSLMKVLIGLLLLGHAVNLLIFSTGRMHRAYPPLIPDGAVFPTPPVADPLPQALILTAIVISFGMIAFAIVLMRQSYQTLGTSDMNELRDTDLQPPYRPEPAATDEEGMA